MPGVTPTGTPPVRRDRRRVRRGSVSLSLHVLIEYGVGVLTILAPFLLSFDSTAAKVVSVLVGAGILVLAVVTDAPTGIARSLPVASHVVLDYVLALFLIVAPFVFGFADNDDAATAYFIVIGVAYIMLAVLTRYRGAKPAA
jgi:SPW repeat-containing protein